MKRRQGVWHLALAVLLAPSVASSAPRRVAILNAAADGDAGARAAATLRRALLGEPELSPLAAGDLSRALESALPAESETDAALRMARAQLDAARDAIAHFEQAEARKALSRSESLLLAVEPDERVLQVLAEVSFQTALVQLRDQKRGLAVAAFRQVLRLTPGRQPLDPARYPPEVIQAFTAARRPVGQPAMLSVSATFDGVPVYLDGVRIGVTPLRTEIAPGSHYLLLVAPEFATEGQRLDAAPRGRVSLQVELERIPLARRAVALRRRLDVSRGPQPEALRRAGRDAALLAGVDAVLVVSDGSGVPSVAVYERNADRLSLFRPVDAEASKLLGLLVPAPPPAPIDVLPTGQPEKPSPSPWYLKPWGVASLGSGAAVLTIIGVVILTSAAIEPDRNSVWVGFGQP